MRPLPASSYGATSAKAKPFPRATNVFASASSLRCKCNSRCRSLPGVAPPPARAVELSLADNSNRALSARIVKVSPTVDAASDSYDVLAQLTGPGLSDLRPGMAVRVVWPGTAQPNSRPKP